MCVCLLQATPKLSENNVKQCVDARLKGEYLPKAAAKVTSPINNLCDHTIIVYHRTEVLMYGFGYGSAGSCSCALCAI